MSNDFRPHLKISEHKPIIDRKFKGGGGGSYKRTEHASHAKKIFKEAQELQKIFEETLDKKIIKHRYFRVELPDPMNVLTSSGRKLSEAVLADLVGSPANNIGHFSTLESSFLNLIEQLKTYRDSNDHSGKSKFASIEDIGRIPAKEKISENLIKLIESKQYSGEALISLFPDLAREEEETLKRAIGIYLKPKNGKVISEVDTNSGKVLRIQANPEIINDLAECFLAIQMVEAIGEVVVESAVKGAKIEDSIVVNPNNSEAYVCIFDSGVVKNSRFLKNSIVNHEEPIGPPHDVEHGSFVASRIIYGNSLRDSLSKGELIPDVKVLSVCMKTHDDIGNSKPASIDQFLQIIRNTVERMHRKIKVYNLSMNITYQNTQTGVLVRDDLVGALAAEIDKLSKKHGVLFVVTTGNYPTSASAPPPSEPYPEYFKREDNRITEPAEAMLALTVGSIADRDNDGSLSKKNMPSPFTRSGPGFNRYRKPDLVAQGGNLTSTWQTFEDLSVAGIGRDGDYLAYGSGTSYAAPIISRLAAQLFEHIKSATPDLVRALLIHSSNLIESEAFDSEMTKKLMGNGLPNAEKLLVSDRWNQNYIFQGQIGYRKIIKIPFYVPKQLTNRSGLKKLRIRFTLAFSPDTDRTRYKGYCKSHLRANLFKRDKNSILKKTPSDKSDEVINDLYSTVIRYDRIFGNGVLEGEWELHIEHVSSRCDSTEESVPFSIVLTLSDPRKDSAIDIYNAIQTEIPNKYENLLTIKEKLRS